MGKLQGPKPKLSRFGVSIFKNKSDGFEIYVDPEKVFSPEYAIAQIRARHINGRANLWIVTSGAVTKEDKWFARNFIELGHRIQFIPKDDVNDELRVYVSRRQSKPVDLKRTSLPSREIAWDSERGGLVATSGDHKIALIS